MGSPYADLDRPPLNPAALTGALVRDGGLWREVRVVAETASTNADLVTAAKAEAVEGLVLVAESQLAGRGRLGRSWVAPPRSGLTFSVLLRPAVPPATWGWLPLLAGVALAQAVSGHSAVPVRLKWPNDLLAPDGRKLAGILAELVPPPSGAAIPDAAIVLGVGLNVTTRAEELAGLPAATSLAVQAATVTDRESLLRAMLRSFASAYTAWQASGGRPVAAYPALCDTIGARVRLALPGGAEVTGTATGVDADGRLEVRSADGTVRGYAAGEVEHLR